jgi:hypothetical protein
MSTVTSDDSPTCRKCEKTLDQYLDMQRSTFNYWKNCQACRDKGTSIKRKARGMSPVQREKTTAVRIHNRAAKTATTRTLKAARPKCATAIKPFLPISPANTATTAIPVPDPVSKLSTSTRNGLECSACSNMFPADQFPRLELCTHESQICHECFANWLTAQVSSSSWDQIPCPSNECDVRISHSEMNCLASQETYKRLYCP